ncbi:MAG: hypothetical protein ACYSVY_27300 [Planctomycetota bacterium]|jgi:transposase-like protein
MSLSDQAKRRYLDGGGVHCPFCESDDIEGGFVEIDAGYTHQSIHCLKCGKEWNDVYKLHDVEERAA